MATLYFGGAGQQLQHHHRQHTSALASTSCARPAVLPPAAAAARRRSSHRAARRGASTVVNFHGSDATATLPGPASIPGMQSFSPAGAASAVASKPKPMLSWAGAGIFFFWQLGAMKFLAEHYDVTRIPMAGASGGALAAVLAACGVSADAAFQRAYDMSVEHNIWERPVGLVGVWGQHIEQWLNDLLPDDAAERCRGRITVIVTTLPNMAQVGISDFKDKADLINVAMASSHIPMLLDLKFARPCRGKWCVDGSFPDFFYNDNCELLKSGGSATVFDYSIDKNLPRNGRMDMLKLKTLDEVKHTMEVGYRYAQQLHLDGHLAHLEVGEVMLDHLDEARREVAPVGAAAQPLSLAPAPVSTLHQ